MYEFEDLNAIKEIIIMLNVGSLRGVEITYGLYLLFCGLLHSSFLPFCNWATMNVNTLVHKLAYGSVGTVTS